MRAIRHIVLSVLLVGLSVSTVSADYTLRETKSGASPTYYRGLVTGMVHALVGIGVMECDQPISGSIVQAALNALVEQYGDKPLEVAVAFTMIDLGCRYIAPESKNTKNPM